MIQTMATAWLYAFSPDADNPAFAYYTIFTDNPPNGRAVYATCSLNYLTTVTTYGAGTWIRSVTPPFGPPQEFHDFAVNSFFGDQVLGVTYGLSARAAEGYAQCNMFFF